MYEIMTFLAKYFFIYEFPNVDIFVSDVLEHIPKEWIEVLVHLPLDKLRKIPYNYYEESWPKSLLYFLFNVNKLAERRYQYVFDERNFKNDIEIPDFIKHKTPIKKLQQITNMALLIQQLAKTYDCDKVIDIGSGLGYLDQIIHHNFGFTTVGFECDSEKTQNAVKRVNSGICSKNMHHINQRIDNTEECKNVIENLITKLQTNEEACNCGEKNKLISKKKGNGNVIMVGLHSCGDLMHSMMELYNILKINVFLSASCCYHKLDPANFPISNQGKSILSKIKEENPTWNITTTGLRLGCQTTRDYWTKQSDDDFVFREKCLSYRAVMQAFLKNENIEWLKPKRHLMRRNIGSFEDFVLLSLNNISLNHLSKENCLAKLNELFDRKRHLFPYIRVLSLLQTLLQPVWELLIIEDRITYFQERGIKPNILVLCNEEITPRNLILCGVK